LNHLTNMLYINGFMIKKNRLIIVVVAYTLVFASGLLGMFLFGELLESPTFPGKLTKSIP